MSEPCPRRMKLSMKWRTASSNALGNGEHLPTAGRIVQERLGEKMEISSRTGGMTIHDYANLCNIHHRAMVASIFPTSNGETKSHYIRVFPPHDIKSHGGS
jgi:hypothetical protein